MEMCRSLFLHFFLKQIFKSSLQIPLTFLQKLKSFEQNFFAILQPPLIFFIFPRTLFVANVFFSVLTLDHLAAEGGLAGTKINIVSGREEGEKASGRPDGGQKGVNVSTCVSSYVHVSPKGTAF